MEFDGEKSERGRKGGFVSIVNRTKKRTLVMFFCVGEKYFLVLFLYYITLDFELEIRNLFSCIYYRFHQYMILQLKFCLSSNAMIFPARLGSLFTDESNESNAL